MYLPTRDDEITGIVGYLDEQLAAVRAAAIGLTEEQANATPCRSALSVAGIVKHVLYGMRGAVERLRTGAPAVYHEDSMVQYMASFSLGEGETVAGLLTDFDEVHAQLREQVMDVDPGADALEAAAPWSGILEERPIRQRFYLLHLIEEYARHAGHADIIREQIDGVSIARLVMTREGAPASDFFQPYEPAPGTVGLN